MIKIYFVLEKSLILLRISLATMFLAHSIVRLVIGSIWKFGDFIENKDFSGNHLGFRHHDF